MSLSEEGQGAQATNQRNLRTAKILLIEDNPDHCTLIQHGLQECMPEIELVITTTYEQTVSQLQCSRQAQQIRLILLDLYLPQREVGWQLLRFLKGNSSPCRLTPVTVLSHSADWEDIQTSYDLGGASYMIKPETYEQWLAYFQSLRQYWWHTVTLPLGR